MSIFWLEIWKNVKTKNNIGPYVWTDKIKQSTISHPTYVPYIKLQVQVPSILEEFFQSIFRQSPFPPTPFIPGRQRIAMLLHNIFYFCKALYFHKVFSHTLYFGYHYLLLPCDFYYLIGHYNVLHKPGRRRCLLTSHMGLQRTYFFTTDFLITITYSFYISSNIII